MDNWKDTIGKIREVKAELASVHPRMGPVIAPPPGAGLRTIAIVERRIGHHLPPSYRAFLHLHDGWPLFFQGASLLGTRELSKPGPFEVTRAAFAAYETPIPEIGPPARPGGHIDAMIPFGVDPTATTIFAFNPAVTSADGEMEVILWVNELGERASSFTDFLSLVLEILELDLSERRALLQKSA
jgi:SMI1 / KNR4 family (SUKH-1)